MKSFKKLAYSSFNPLKFRRVKKKYVHLLLIYDRVANSASDGIHEW
jgi:hypothetical protein